MSDDVPLRSSRSSIASSDCNVPQAGGDGISSLKWSPSASSNMLLSTNWDGGVRSWEATQVVTGTDAVQVRPMAQVQHENSSPVLDACFSADGSKIFSCGADKAVRLWDLGAAPPKVPPQIGTHDAPVKAVCYLAKSNNMVVSGGWDSKLKYWDCRAPSPVLQVDLPERVYAMDCQNNLLVVATAGRNVIAYDVTMSGSHPRECFRKESPLSYQTSSVAVFPNADGFLIGDIAGGGAVRYLKEQLPHRNNFTFKCALQDPHRYAVNDIAFVPRYSGIFATVGSNGIVSFWDKDKKKRIETFDAIDRPISAAAFNSQSNLFAYASSYDWSKGSTSVIAGNEIFVHRVDPKLFKKK